MKVHELKTWQEPFDAVWYGGKRHEVRKNDRGFERGDLLVLQEYDLERGYRDRIILADVTHVTKGGEWGLPADLCVMTIRPFMKRERWNDKWVPAEG